MNLILATDSYKLTHHRMYPPDVRVVHSYTEARTGAWGPQNVVFFGLQPLLYALERGIHEDDIKEALDVAEQHFATDLFDSTRWQRLLNEHNGLLPLKIWALPEGTVVPRGTPLMAIENTDPEFPWLTNHVESLLMHVWYPTTIASMGFELRRFFDRMVPDGLPQYMLHDFGYRGVSSDESAAIGGAAHLVNFMGTDTLPVFRFIDDIYGGPTGFANIGHSVAASEHSVMTQWGQDGELTLIQNLIRQHPNQILSLVADSFDYYQFVQKVKQCVEQARANGTKLVVRPDSVTPEHATPLRVIQWTLTELPDDVNVLYGDGLSAADIKYIVERVAPDQRKRLVFGMGGGLLQKVNRDTMRFATKCSAVQLADGQWRDVQKNPLDVSKKSRAGRQQTPEMELVFDRVCLKDHTFSEIRARVAAVR